MDELTRARKDGAEIFALWKKTYAKINLLSEKINAEGRPPTEDEQREFDLYNRLNETNSAIHNRLAQLEKSESERLRFTDEKSIAVEFEERTFWFRRFHTSLAIAHGAAFAAAASHLFDDKASALTAAAAWIPMAIFASGMILAGSLPIALHRRAELLAWRLAGVSALLFIVGVVAVLAAVWRKAGYIWPHGFEAIVTRLVT